MKTLRDDIKRIYSDRMRLLKRLLMRFKYHGQDFPSESSDRIVFVFRSYWSRKTELSKQLAEQLGVEFIRFDMSEYAEPHTVSRLIGALRDMSDSIREDC